MRAHMTPRYVCCHQTGADVRESRAVVAGARKKLRTAGLLEEEKWRTAVLHDSPLGSRQTPNRKESPQYVWGTSARGSWKVSFASSLLQLFWFSGRQLFRISTSGLHYRTVWSSDLLSQVHVPLSSGLWPWRRNCLFRFLNSKIWMWQQNSLPYQSQPCSSCSMPHAPKPSITQMWYLAQEH